jgi:glycosyltransferase involved in cell wall biosynthesis
MNQKAAISVIIPFYNEEAYLSRAIQSVLSQTYSAVEIILVNDGSTDSSIKIAEEYAQKYTQIKLVTQENQGPGVARNTGISHLNSYYVAFLDADDTYIPNALELLLGKIEKTKSDLCIGNWEMKLLDESVIKKSNYIEEVVSADEVIERQLREEVIPTAWGKLFRVEIIERCTFPAYSWKEDDVFFIEYLLQSEKVSFINETILNNYCQSGSLTRQLVSFEMIENFKQSYLHQEKLLRESGYIDLLPMLWRNIENTLVSLLIIISLDYNKVENITSIEQPYFELLEKISRNIYGKKTLKQWMKKQLLYIPKIIGWKWTSFISKLLYKKRVNNIIEIRA